MRLRSTTEEFVLETTLNREPWNKGKLVGQKPPLKPKDIWAIRIHLQNAHQVRDLAMFNLAIDRKLRGCDLVNLRVRDITHGNQILARAMVVQRKLYGFPDAIVSEFLSCRTEKNFVDINVLRLGDCKRNCPCE